MGELEIRNTAKRTNDLVDAIGNVMESGTLSFKEGQVLRGKLGFAQAQLFGLSGKHVLQQLSEHTFAVPFRNQLSEVLRDSLAEFSDKLKQGGPRIGTRSARHTKFLLTDASFDVSGSGGIGGVLCDQDGGTMSWFQRSLSSEDVNYFKQKDHENAIAELEALAVLVAIRLWNPVLMSQHVVVGLDNDVVRYCFIKGYCKAKGVCALVRLAARLLESSMILPWFLRVASASNIADFPSRSKPHVALLPCLEVEAKSVKECLDDLLADLFP